MHRNTLSKYPLISEAMLYIRQNIFLIGVLIFLVLNWGNSFQALKFSIFYFGYCQMSERGRIEEYPNLISEYNLEVLAATLCFILISLLISLFLMWYIDTIELRRSLMTRELRHLSKSVSQKKKLLKEQEKCLSARIQERQLKKEQRAVILKMEEILQRYEYACKALNPDIVKRAKLSETDPSFQDLFDFTKSQKRSKPKPKPKPKYRRKFKAPKIKF